MLSVFLALLLAAGVHGALVHRDWELAPKEISPDGFKRNAELVNGVFPGPVLTANKGDVIQVNVKNHLLDSAMVRSTSIVGPNIFYSPLFTNIICSIGMGLYDPVVSAHGTYF
jgi:iron transport multicopper oxidase